MEKLFFWLINAYPIRYESSSRRIKFHLFFWLIWGFFTYLSVISDAVWQYKILVASSSVLQGILIYYTSVYYIIPKFFSAKTFFLSILGILLIYCINWFLMFYFYKIAFTNNYLLPKMYLYNYALTYVSNGIWGILTVKNAFFELLLAFQSISLPFLLKFSRIGFQYYEASINIQKEKNDIEVNFLRGQLNPHFLLNSLNNIYSQVISQDGKAADSVIVLSNLLKYTLYDSNTERISLKREVRFIRDYIDLEKLRYNKNLNVLFTEEGFIDGYCIAPLILICFIENAFKHGIKVHNSQVSNISINIKLKEGTLFFSIENDLYPILITKNTANRKIGGVGLINTKKRLQLLYPQKYNLIIKNESNKFIVNLTIQLEKMSISSMNT